MESKSTPTSSPRLLLPPDTPERQRRAEEVAQSLHRWSQQLGSWIGEAPSVRNVVYYYNESEMTAIRIGNWKSHFQTREGFFDYNRRQHCFST